MSAELFNSSYYASANSDLRAAGITTESQLRSHFQSFGLNEGRRFSSFCNLDIYKAENTDLAKAGLTSNSQLLSHLETYGVNEGRKFSEFVDIDFYLNKNLDVKTFYQGNREKALGHLQSFGLNEGRAFSKFIDVDYYLAVNSDVKNALSGSRSAALQHLEQYGISENRLFSSIVDLSLYKTLNSDLSTLNNTQLFQHLGTYGLGESRQFSYSFNLDYYANNNPDLISAYASDRKLSVDAIESNPGELGRLAGFLLGHFEISGITEGRRSSAEFDVSTYKIRNADLASLDNQQLYKHFRTYGINEARVYSDTYDASYYRDHNTAPDGSKLQQLFAYYLLEGADKGDIAVRNIKRPNEIGERLELIDNSATKEGVLSINDESNQTRPGTFSQDYILDGIDAGQTVTINMTSTAFDTYLQIIDLDTGKVIIENNNSTASTTNSSVTFKDVQGTQYLVRATGVSFKDLGAYSLVATASSRSVGTLIVGSQASPPASSTLDATSYRDPINPGRFSEDRNLDVTSVAVEQAVKLTVTSNGFTPIIQLVNAGNGDIIASGKTNSANSATLTFTRNTGVKYVVRTTGEAAASGGNFTLAAELIPVTGLTAIAKQQTINGALNTTNPTDTYRLDTTGTNAGDKVQINLNSTDFNTLLTVIPTTGGAAGSVLENDDAGDNTRNSELTLTIAANTTYEIKVTRSAKDTQNVGNYNLTTSPIAANQAGSGVTLTDTGLQELLGTKTTLSRGDILAFFAQAQINGITTTEKNDLRTIVNHAEQFRLSNDVRFLTDRVVSNITVDMTAVDFETNLVSPLFFGTKPAIANYVGEGDTARGDKAIPKTTQFTYAPILGSLYGANTGDGRTLGEPRARDINQKHLGDCAFLGALGALFLTPQFEGTVNLGSLAIKDMIISNGEETYNGKSYETWSFRFYSKDSPYYVSVDRRVVTYDGELYGAARGGAGSATSSRLTDDGQAIWVPLAEKAYAEFREKTVGDGIKSGYTLIGNGDNAASPLEALTGRTATYNSSPTFEAISAALASGKSLNVAVVKNSTFLTGGHAFSLTRAYETAEGEKRVVLRNPWGTDGQQGSGNLNDGFIDVSFKEFSTAPASSQFAFA